MDTEKAFVCEWDLKDIDYVIRVSRFYDSYEEIFGIGTTLDDLRMMICDTFTQVVDMVRIYCYMEYDEVKTHIGLMLIVKNIVTKIYKKIKDDINKNVVIYSDFQTETYNYQKDVLKDFKEDLNLYRVTDFYIV